MTKRYPKISIITPSYNQVKFIEKTILSVLSQNYPNLEYIVIDGNSNDGTKEILRKYKNQIIYLSENDSGQTNALNKGIKVSTGEIISYLNSDDLCRPGALHSVSEFFIKNKDAYFLTGKCKIINENGKITRRLISAWKNFWLKNNNLLDRMNSLIVLNYISQPATYWKREIITNVGFFNESLAYAMDYDFWLRILEKYKLFILDKDLALFRIQNKSKSVLNYSKQLEESFNIAKKYSNSSLYLFLHRLHDFFVLKSYRIIN